MTIGPICLRWRQRSGHWSLLVLGIVAVLAMGSAFWLGWQATNDTEERIESGRLGLAELAAAHADHIVTEAFFELELVAEIVRLDAESERAPATNFSAPLLLLDVAGGATAIGAGASPRPAIDPRVAEIAATLVAGTDRSVSEPFVLPATGHPTVALSIPLFDDGGVHTGTVVGFLDVDEHLRTDLQELTEQFGASAHVDLIDGQGAVLASSEHDPDAAGLEGLDGADGHHVDFYRRAASERRPMVELVPHPDGSPPHIVAYAPLSGAPWGIALGASEADTFATPDARRRQLVGAAIASAVTLALGLLLVTVEVRGGNEADTPR